MSKSQVVVITGMHRSGTSLIASVLQNAGVFIGEQLMGGNKGNPRGHFEDLDFYSFNESILKRNQKSFLVQDMDGLRDFSPEDIEWANSLVSQRENEPIWGWKDPRTTLFLDFWNERIPQATYIFLYRHPIAVCHSLMRRAAVYPENDAQSGLKAWCVYNQEILDFIAKHQEKCFLGNIDQISLDLPGFITLLNDRFELALNESIDASIFHPEELNRSAYDPVILDAFRKAAPQPFELYELLENLADLAGAKSPDELKTDREFSTALQIVIQSQLSSQHSPDAQLNYLFSLIDPVLANNRALQINEMLVEQQKVHEAIHNLNIQVVERDTSIQELTSQISELRNHLDNKIVLVHSLVQQSAEREALLQGLKFQVSEQETRIRTASERINSLEHVNQTYQGELALSQDEAVAYAVSNSWRITRPLRKKRRYIHDLLGYFKHANDYFVIKRSGMFDGHYYLKNNPDVRQADIDPLLHFVQHGWKDGRSSSVGFDTGAYLATYSDVAASGANPLLHYLRHGKSEGRDPKPVVAPVHVDVPTTVKPIPPEGSWLDEDVLEVISKLAR